MKNSMPKSNYSSDHFKVLTAKVILVIFLVEALLMLVLPLLGSVSIYQEALLDATMLTLISAPIIYFWIIRKHLIGRDLIDKQAKSEHAFSATEAKGSVDTHRQIVSSTKNFLTDQLPEYQVEHGYIQSLITPWLQEWKERRFAVATSRELLAQYRKIKDDHPELSDRERFNILIMARNSWSEIEAYEVLKAADESFAAWPVARELTLADVIHYQVFLEFMAKRDVMHCTHINFESEIKSVIPSDFCITKLNAPYVSERRRRARCLYKKTLATDSLNQSCAVGRSDLGIENRLNSAS